MVNDLLNQNKITLDQLAAIAISGGPGSYTGLRIGASFAKGICYAQQIPLISVNSLAVIAAAMKETHPNADRYCALIDARRMDAYCAVYDGDLNAIQEASFETLDSSLFNQLSGEVWLGGSGAAKAMEFCQGGPQLSPASTEARHMALLAQNSFENQAFEDLAYYEPNYIKAVHITSPKKKTLP